MPFFLPGNWQTDAGASPTHGSPTGSSGVDLPLDCTVPGRPAGGQLGNGRVPAGEADCPAVLLPALIAATPIKA